MIRLQLLSETVIICRVEERESVTDRSGWSATGQVTGDLRQHLTCSSSKFSDVIFADQQTQ